MSNDHKQAFYIIGFLIHKRSLNLTQYEYAVACCRVGAIAHKSNIGISARYLNCE
ncbi:hypothetical protein [Nostoc sp. CHAB 5715]|uniref:hypothetical protein n=1 Tax=Nostoc sp. CHAB 5715 TaxID=2780400 RepID=UPI001E3FF969|nr:hypothetical protein [Nostoc sp. CHAB 5715]MCC5622580.1 hypothetical protein [Nostoc sp. CHAB 5715]